ncbi:MAG: tRNA (N6-threonylcarbamoyladenosine(37)-N6)-methyltransferase TrmO [Sphaerochaetaceae bacterium]|nr:tRNA (N6-threonylcarbamoyladenosine(37)-N6)-methyltransferase TrmO [Sphaerochaetaceae bacterium]
MTSYEFRPIGTIHTDFSTKFGVPRQSSLVPQLEAQITMLPEFRSHEAFRGLEGCKWIWLLWVFSEAVRDSWSPTVRPPRLGGEKRMGVFATRSPFRPNPIGMSSVQLQSIEYTEESGPVLHVLGADLMDGTPILDIKPYICYSDSHSDAMPEYLKSSASASLSVDFPSELLSLVPQPKREALIAVLSQDPRPRFQHDPDRIYGMEFAGLDIRFTIDDSAVHVVEVKG